MHAEADRDCHGVAHSNVVRVWSIGQWVQVNPEPDTEDIYDWYTDLHLFIHSFLVTLKRFFHALWSETAANDDR